MTKKFDLILYGASGFTGKLVVEYLLSKYGMDKDVKWAIGGRNEAKLKSVMNELNAPSLPYIVADSLNQIDMDKLAENTHVVCSTVGPYAKYGSNLIASCIKYKTHYCDLTGEVQWIRKMINVHHEEAKNNKVKIVHCCGFDSIPSDMGVYFLQKNAKEIHGAYCRHIKLRVKAMKGGISGGTYASLSHVLAEAESDPNIMKVISNPYSLNPQEEMTGPDQPDINTAVYDPDFKSWLVPFIMAGINTRVVRRSHALSGYPYGQDFMYDEASLTGDGQLSKIKSKMTSTMMGKFSNMKSNSITKKLADRFLPKPGEGPSKSQRENGFFKLLLLGKFSNGKILKAQVTGDRDPGYGSTSKMLGESAVCLVKEFDDIPNTFGLLTPSTAMGDQLLTRLHQNAGLQFNLR